MEAATQELGELALDKATKLDMLEDAERRIENRLNDALLPRLVNYSFTHVIKFLESTTKDSSIENEESNNKVLEMTLGE